MTKTTIEGVYENGVVKLSEIPPTGKSMKVMVVFVEETDALPKKVRKAGFGKGTFTYIAPDFDEPLEELKDYM